MGRAGQPARGDEGVTVGGSEAGDGVPPAVWSGAPLDGAATGFQELADDGQPQPAAIPVGGWGAPEPVKGPLALLGGHPWALVDDVQLDPAADLPDR